MTNSHPAHTVGVTDPEPRWSLDPRVKHLNHGSFGAVPVTVQEEQQRLRGVMEANPVRWFASLPERIVHARLEMADLLDADPAHMAFVLNASAGASVVYQALMDRGPARVLVTNHGYGAVSMGARRLAERTGGRLDVAEVPLDATAAEVVDILGEAMDRQQPSLVVVDQVTSATAREFPVDEICRLARTRNAITLVDGAHAPGVMPDPICREADYWIGNLHKFACAPRGAAVIVARGDGQELFPVIDSWGSPFPFPERFDHNGTLDITPWLVAPFAWRHIEATIGWDQLRADSRKLMDEGVALVTQALQGAVEDVVPDVGQPVGPMRLLRLPAGLGETHPEADALRVPFSDATGIALAFTHFEGRGYLRLSAHSYNSLHDYQYLASVGIPLLHRWSLDKVRGTTSHGNHTSSRRIDA